MSRWNKAQISRLKEVIMAIATKDHKVDWYYMRNQADNLFNAPNSENGRAITELIKEGKLVVVPACDNLLLNPTSRKKTRKPAKTQTE